MEKRMIGFAKEGW